MLITKIKNILRGKFFVKIVKKIAATTKRTKIKANGQEALISFCKRKRTKIKERKMAKEEKVKKYAKE